MAYLAGQRFPNGWLNFELSVLRRLKFASIAIPFTGEPNLSRRLKQWDVRVAANDPLAWSSTKAAAFIENNSERLTEDDINTLVEDAYVPRDRLDNPSILRWFNETDAWWFDTVRFNAERLETSYKRALALTLGMMVGDYVLSFEPGNRQLREPLSLSRLLREWAEALPHPHDNSQRNKATNQDVRSFIAERRHTDLLFLRLPHPHGVHAARLGRFAWREEWIQGGNDFWDEIESAQAGRLGTRVESKKQYLRLIEDVLLTAAHMPAWAIVHNENGFISTEELAETVGRVRRVSTIYTKDFSDLFGGKTAIVTAVD